MPLPVSVLDLSPVGSGSTGAQALNNTLDLARHAERLGFSRYWLAEHHNLPSVASSAPEIMIGQVARETSTIRVGSGGIMLPNHSPLKVAEWFRVLEALFPGRIDLGIGRAPGTDQITALALRRSRDAMAADDFPQQLAEMLAYNSDDFPDGHPFKTISAVPVDVDMPPIFLLGSSGYSAHYAAAVGFGFAFAHHINPHDAVAVMRAYREQFTPSEHLDKPWAILGLSVICADTEERAAELGRSVDLSFLRLQANKRGPLPSPEEAAAYQFTPAEQTQALANRNRFIVGAPATVKARIDELVEQCAADEIMVTTNIHSHAERVHSYELLAEMYDLTPTP